MFSPYFNDQESVSWGRFGTKLYTYQLNWGLFD
jgi:hypothetical protein